MASTACERDNHSECIFIESSWTSDHAEIHRAIGRLGPIDMPWLEELIQRTKNPFMCDEKYGNSPLHYAAWNNHLESIALLLRYGHPLVVRNLDGWTPMHHAVAYHHIAAIKALMTHGHSLDVTSNDGSTPLHIAATCMGTSAIYFLVHAGLSLVETLPSIVLHYRIPWTT